MVGITRSKVIYRFFLVLKQKQMPDGLGKDSHDGMDDREPFYGKLRCIAITFPLICTLYIYIYICVCVCVHYCHYIFTILYAYISHYVCIPIRYPFSLSLSIYIYILWISHELVGWISMNDRASSTDRIRGVWNCPRIKHAKRCGDKNTHRIHVCKPYIW